jgi:16S rRNA G966 N2-methylase RsmD
MGLKHIQQSQFNSFINNYISRLETSWEKAKSYPSHDDLVEVFFDAPYTQLVKVIALKTQIEKNNTLILKQREKENSHPDQNHGYQVRISLIGQPNEWVVD